MRSVYTTPDIVEELVGAVRRVAGGKERGPMTVYIETWKNKHGRWFARAVARNGNELARTSEGDGYPRPGRATDALMALRYAKEIRHREARPVKRRRK